MGECQLRPSGAQEDPGGTGLGAQPRQAEIRRREQLEAVSLAEETAFLTSLSLMAGPAFPYRVIPQEGRIIPFAEIAQYHAVVIVPWSPELCMLRHLFKMRMPLLVPELSMLRNLVHVANQRLLPYPYHAVDPLSDRSLVDAIHPYDPFLDTARAPADERGAKARAYWAEYSEYLLLPELLRFASAADLLARLNAMEGQKVSQRMANAYRNDMLEMMSFWQELMPILLRKCLAFKGNQHETRTRARHHRRASVAMAPKARKVRARQRTELKDAARPRR